MNEETRVLTHEPCADSHVCGTCERFLPEFEIFHMTDESLIRNTIAAQRLTPITTRRLAAMIGSAHEGGASAVMVTCSSIGPAVRLRDRFTSSRFSVSMRRWRTRQWRRAAASA